jgi:cytochrome c-type biogenesis protein CcmH/NrfG
LALAYQHLGDDNEATGAYQRAFDLAPRESQFKTALANCKAHLGFKAQSRGDAEEAVRLYRDVITLDPTNHTVLYNIGLAYHAAGRPDEALDAFEKAVALDRDNAEYRAALERLKSATQAGSHR